MNAAIAANLTQSHYRWRNDGGGEYDNRTYQVSATADTTITCTCDVLVSGMTVTPGAAEFVDGSVAGQRIAAAAGGSACFVATARTGVLNTERPLATIIGVLALIGLLWLGNKKKAGNRRKGKVQRSKVRV